MNLSTSTFPRVLLLSLKLTLLPSLLIQLFQVLLVSASLTSHCGENGVDTVKLQLQWVTQPQFAGFFVSKFFEAECISLVVRGGGTSLDKWSELDIHSADFVTGSSNELLSNKFAAGLNYTIVSSF